tara:strand:+ start:334 stop:621 length:288 start_codon:yes stop_codon:yes gene_type:complete
MPSQNIEKIEIDGNTYDYASLSPDAQTTIAVISELSGRINEFKKESHFLEVTRGVYESKLKTQLPSKALDNSDTAKNSDKQDKNSGESATNKSKS